MSVRIGSVDARTFINWQLPSQGVAGLLSNVLVANLPQVILSAIYYTYNSIFTSFMLATEWEQYSMQRKGLRVSASRRGAQRSTYFLQLPYRFALPLMVLSGLMHWLCSQSIYLVSLEGPAKYRLKDGDEEYITCGYAPGAILGVICIGSAMVAIVNLVGRKRFGGTIPVAGSCSASMSAMCHLPENEDGVETVCLPLQWGVTDLQIHRESYDQVGHCSFSSGAVGSPQEAQLFAGFYTSQNSMRIEITAT